MKKFYLLLTGLFLTLSGLYANQGFMCHHFANTAAARGVEAIASPGHVALMKKYDVGFYFLDLNIQRTSPYSISGNVLVRAKSLVNNLDTFGIELANQFTIDSVQAAIGAGSFQLASFARTGTSSDIRIALPSAAAINQTVQVKVYYRGNPQTSTSGPTGGGVFTGNNIFTASPPYNSSTWWPCKQSLTDKADSSWFFITTDSANLAVANGLLKNTVSVPGGKNRWEYKSKYPIAYYLIAFVVGSKTTMAKTTRYFQPTGRTDSMAVAGYGMNPTNGVDILRKFSTLFGLYPFYDETLGLANVNLGGGMENQTIIAMGNIGTVMEHEIMHQWFGDHVTCSSFRDLWLNEGLARWGEAVYAEFAAANQNAANTARISLCNQFENGNPLYGALGAVGRPTSSIYYYTSDTNSITSLYGGVGRDMYYEKPAMMLNSLRFELNNDAVFFKALRDYLEQYAGGTANGADFIDAIETSTGMDLTDFFDSWYYGYGFPTFGLKWHQKNGRLALQVSQTGSSPNTPLFKTSLEVKIKRAVSDTTVRIYVNQNPQTFQIPVSDSITGFTIDPNQWIANKTGTIAQDTSLIIETNISGPAEERSSYSVYPNPTTGTLHITSGQAGEVLNVLIFNSVGQLISRKQLADSRTLNVSELPQGLYFVQINDAKRLKVLLMR